MADVKLEYDPIIEKLNKTIISEFIDNKYMN